MSIAFCEFPYLAKKNLIWSMQTASETRRARLEMLIKKHGSVAALNTALEWARTDPKLAQIRNANPRPGRDKPYQMGDAMARELEAKLGLEHGWMDTPPSYAELHDGSDPMAKAMAVMEHMPDYQWPKVLQMLDIFAQPEPKNGTHS